MTWLSSASSAASLREQRGPGRPGQRISPIGLRVVWALAEGFPHGPVGRLEEPQVLGAASSPGQGGGAGHVCFSPTPSLLPIWTRLRLSLSLLWFTRHCPCHGVDSTSGLSSQPGP